MKIELVLPSLFFGGTEKMVACLAQGLATRGHTVQVVALKETGPIGERLMTAGIPVAVLHTPSAFWPGLIDIPRATRALRQATQTFQPDIVHSFLTRANVMTRYALGAPRVPVILGSLRVMEKEKTFHLWAEKWRSASAVLTVNSQILKDFAVETIGLRADQVQVIYNGVETPAPMTPAEIQEIKAEYHVAGKKMILAAGRLHSQKGFDLLVGAFAELAPEIPDAVLVIAGEGPEEQSLRQQIERLRLQSQVRLVGAVPNLPALLGVAEVFVLSSRWEGTPNVILEAMAAGCPIVSTDVGGVREILNDPQEGTVIAAGDSGALRVSLRAALTDPAAARARARQAQIHAQTFSMEKMVTQHLTLYENIITHRRA